MQRLVSAVGIPFLLAGCVAVGPDFETPTMPLQTSYIDAVATQPLQNVATQTWWENFNDPYLTGLVETGLRQNLDIATAIERIRAAEATVKGTGLAAALSGELSASKTRSGADDSAVTSVSRSGLSANLVVDIFGGVKRGQQQALADLETAFANVETARLGYLSAIVGAYIDARYYQYAIEITQQSIVSREQTLKITQKQRAVGAATELAEERVKALLFSARADIPDLESNYLANIYKMATLLNTSAEKMVADMNASAAATDLLGLNLNTHYATGIPADLLRNRPDIRAAEQSLASATAAIGVATAKLLPALTLAGTVTDFSNNSWSFGPTLSLPLFNQRSLFASKAVAVSQAREAELNWRATVLAAVEDVQSANSAWLRDRKKVDWLNQSVSAYERSLELSLASYEIGVFTLLDLLDTDRSLASARLSLASALRDLSVDWATLQISLGAGAAVVPD